MTKIRSGQTVSFLSAVFLLAVSISARIDRVDIFDRAGNSLLFVEFEYDAEGKNTGRSVYASDSTFLRRTAFVNDNAGKRIREVSFDFNNDTIGRTDFSTIGNKPGISVFDQFNLDQFGAPVSYTASGEHSFDIYHNGSVVYKMKYVYDTGGDLSRIEVLSPQNELLYYASVSTPSSSVKGYTGGATVVPKITFSANHFHLSADFNSVTDVKLCIYDLSGRLVSVPFSKRLKPGLFKGQFSIDEPGRRLPGGVYIARLYINDKASASTHRFINKAGSLR